jgi:chromosome segregation ATPase
MIEPKVMEFSEGEYVRYEDYARLKAECQARQAENSVLAVECDSLKAEVERLTEELRKSEEHNEALCERMQDLNSNLFAASNINGKLHMKRANDLVQMGGQCEEITRLKAEVERLTKAGDAMAADLIGEFGDYKSVDDWNAAKEGKQS